MALLSELSSSSPSAFADHLTEGIYFSASSKIPCQQQGEEGLLTC